MKAGKDLTAFANELLRQQKSKRDLSVPQNVMRFSTSQDGGPLIAIPEGDGEMVYGVTSLARRQLAEKLGIPYTYFERMRAELPELLDRNVNAWLQKNDDRRLVRTMDGDVRAVLSDRYRRLDNSDLAEAVLPTLMELPGAQFESMEITETRMYIKVVTERLNFDIAPGDTVQAGIVISNSEVGQGPLSVQPLIYRLVCKNGLIVPDTSLRKTHVGRTLVQDPVSGVYRDDTLDADDKAFFLKVRDVVASAVSEATFLASARKMQQTLGIEVKNPVKAVEVLAQRHSLTSDDASSILKHLISGGNVSGYGLVNAVTRYSQDVTDYDRATELEALGGKLTFQAANEWDALAVA